MQTPKEYTSNLTNGIVTEEMLSDCLYSCNKRAKNWRDKKREVVEMQHAYRYFEDKYNTVFEAECRMAEYYGMKERLLSVLQPEFIHHETQTNYFWLSAGKTPRDANAKRTGGINYDDERDRWEYEYKSVKECYYLYYKCGCHTFHTPIPSTEKYPDLPVVELEGGLTTYGADTGDLLSVQFVKKVVALVETGEYTFKRTADKAVA